MMMAFCMVFTASAVGTNTSKRTLAKSLKIEKSGDVAKVTKNGKAYTGSFWSNDAKSIQYRAENGKVVSTIVYYPNDKICYWVEDGKKPINYLRNGQHVAKLRPADAQYAKKVIKEQGI